MVVICKIEPCPFRSSSGFCRNKLLSIDQQGRCKHLYDPAHNWRDPVSEDQMDGYELKQEEKKNEEK